MKAQSFAVVLLTLVSGLTEAKTFPCPPILQFESKPLQGATPVDFCEAYAGKVILAVNTASQCGYTPQFKGLESLYQEFKGRGLVVLGFPSNDFKQEHDNPEQTAQVCYVNYGVTFPMFARGPVTGEAANPFFKELARQTGVIPQWNFQKYVVNRAGKVLKAFLSNVSPDDVLLRATIEAALAETSATP